jgi:methyl-accepting chemotaxis protein
MGNEKKLSEEMEINFSEAITVSTKTLKSVDAIFDDIKKNRSKLQRIVESNKYSSENLKALSAEIDSIQENVSSISKISERIKIVALNAELVSNSISLEGLNFNKVATEIRTLTDNLMEFSARIYDTVQEITSDGKKLVKDSEICVEKINESNGILSQLENRFSDIKNTAGAATINSAEISADIHSKVSAFKTIIDTLLKISASVNVFNTSTWEVAASIEKLRENSEHILNLNSKYNNQGGSA